MLNISSNGIIEISRGDTFTTPITINAGNDLSPKQYVLKDNDCLYFGLCEPNQPFEEALVRKVYDKNSKTDENGNVLLSFTSEDTTNLIPGKYYYTVKLKHQVDNVENIDTIISRRLFYIWD